LCPQVRFDIEMTMTLLLLSFFDVFVVQDVLKICINVMTSNYRSISSLPSTVIEHVVVAVPDDVVAVHQT